MRSGPCSRPRLFSRSRSRLILTSAGAPRTGGSLLHQVGELSRTGIRRVLLRRTTNECLQEVVDTRRRMTTRSSKEWLCGQSRVVSAEVPASQQVRGSWLAAWCLVLGACRSTYLGNQEDRLSTWPGPGGSCSLLGDVWPWLRAELFQHQPSSTPISRHGKGTGPIWNLAPHGLDPRAATVVRRGCRWLKILHVSFRAVFWLVTVGSLA